MELHLLKPLRGGKGFVSGHKCTRKRLAVADSHGGNDLRHGGDQTGERRRSTALGIHGLPEQVEMSRQVAVDRTVNQFVNDHEESWSHQKQGRNHRQRQPTTDPTTDADPSEQ